MGCVPVLCNTKNSVRIRIRCYLIDSYATESVARGRMFFERDISVTAGGGGDFITTGAKMHI